jgi:putative transposase
LETHLHPEFVLDALNMALGQRRPTKVIHCSDHGTQYTSIAFVRRQQAGVLPSMGSVSDCLIRPCARDSRHPGMRTARYQQFQAQVKARIALFDFIGDWCNS